MNYIADEDINITDISVSKSRLVTFLRNEFGNLLTSFCVDKKTGTVFHRTKADLQTSLSFSLHASSNCAPISQPVDASFLNRKVHEVINHQKSQCNDQSLKLDLMLKGLLVLYVHLPPSCGSLSLNSLKL